MIDREGYRPNVGIILCNAHNEVFWGKRIREHSWQFPQGGIKQGESPEQAMYRELMEEVGLRPEHVRILGRTRDWLRYDVPTNWIKREWRGSYKGQKQIWFLLRMVGRDCDVSLRACAHPGKLDETTGHGDGESICLKSVNAREQGCSYVLDLGDDVVVPIRLMRLSLLEIRPPLVGKRCSHGLHGNAAGR